MDDVFIGEIRMFAGIYAPEDWHFCDGTKLPITGNTILFSLLGKQWGGDGVTNFALPDLCGRVPIGQGTGNGLSPRPLAQQGGEEEVSLEPNHLAPHSHAFIARNTLATAMDPINKMLASVPSQGNTAGMYMKSPNIGQNVVANANFITFAGGEKTGRINGAPHRNMMPSLAVNYIIALVGLYPENP